MTSHDDGSGGSGASSAAVGTGAKSGGGSAGHSLVSSGRTGSGGAAASGAGTSGGTGTAGAPQRDAGAVQDAGALRGCELNGRRYSNGARDIPAPDGCNSCICNDARLACTEKACTSVSECVVARRLDQCCESYEPVSRATLAADECLVPYPATGTDETLVARCQARNKAKCDLVDCAPMQPPSRVASMSTSAGCAYADECQRDEDCVLANDEHACCACAVSMPAALLQSDICLRSPSASAAPASCIHCPSRPACGPCPMPSPARCLVLNSSYSLCM